MGQLNFAGIPKTKAAAISAANTNRDGSGTLVTVMTAGSNGSKMERVRIQATGPTTAGVVRLFLSDGTSNWLLREVLVAAATPSQTVEAFSAEVDCSAARDILVLPNGWSLKAAPHNAEGFNVIAVYGDF